MCEIPNCEAEATEFLIIAGHEHQLCERCCALVCLAAKKAADDD